MTVRLNALGEIGGVNSINNFARSWTRAAGFHEVTPQRPAFLLSGEEPGPYTEEQLFSRSDIEHRGEGASLIRAHLERSRSGDEEAIEDDNDITPRPLGPEEAHKHRLGSDMGSMVGSVRGRQSIFEIAPHLASPLAGSYGTSYGTLYSTLDESSMRNAGRLWQQQEEARAAIPDGERPLLLVKEVEQDGEMVFLIQGQSTLPQTVFNSTNVLIGIGILSLPLGMRYSGWILGTIFLSLAAAVTAYTAKLLAKCMDVDHSLITFADLAFISYGQKARVATSILFSLELLAACVALVVLFADTLNLLIPSVEVNQWKILCGFLLVPLNFAPLRLLSFSSILGILCCFSSKSDSKKLWHWTWLIGLSCSHCLY
jgi:vesicular inhibitory amino acid transporter